MKLNRIFLSVAMAGTMAGMTTSCSDMLDKGNEYVIYTEGHELTTPADTVTSLLGILNQLQAIAVRTNLLGEVRADMVNVNQNATVDLKNLANFDCNVMGEDDANKYNVPRDYYGVINNCNYYLAIADSTAGNTNRNEKYFKNEIAQVHSIRAWVYLQTVLAYGRIPLVLDPVLTKLDSEKQYPMVELVQVCDEFINDLKPYYGREYPDPQTIGGSIDPKLAFFPTQVVMGDLYLYKAVATQDPEMAKEAAKCYYDYIMWDKSGKEVLTMSTARVRWTEDALYREKYNSYSTSLPSNYYGSNWGKKNEGITAIAMDSASTSGFYNELRNLYNYTYKTEVQEAAISPSQLLFDLSESQQWFGYDTNKKVVEVTRDKLDDDMLEDHMAGDLRLSDCYSKRKITLNSTEYNQQTIYKHSGQHVGIYRQTQLYLRLAEALNYAGYPRFAKTFLTIGPNNTVIRNEVLPYYPTSADSAFINYFNFNDNTFKSYAESYSVKEDSLLVPVAYQPVYSSDESQMNMMGIHSRGSGLAFLNPNYFVALTPDSTEYPVALAQQVGHRPATEDYDFPTEPKEPKVVLGGKVPSTWKDYPYQTLDEEAYRAYINYKGTDKAFATVYKRYSNDTIPKYTKYLEDVAAYEKDHAQWVVETDSVQAVMDADEEAWQGRHAIFWDAYSTWRIAAYKAPSLLQKEQAMVDELILNEQALEMTFEGNRFFDLMRRALWYNDNSRLASPIAKRNPSLEGKLMNRQNWYMKWKGQIGY